MEIKVAAYFSSEVNEKALSLQNIRFGDRITAVGCATKLTNQKLDLFGPIDLLIGGSPCSDLSRVNPTRRGLYDPSSSGRLFFDFLRILNYLQTKAKDNGTSFYWLYENTFNMEKDTLNDISRYLQCDPVIRCASEYVPMRRKRFFWGNIPRMYHPRVVRKCSLTLQSFLMPNRRATVDQLPTVTTKQNCQRSGKKKKLPVLDNGKESKLFIVEIEKIFGFAESYTDGPNLSYTDRLRLLGKCWCVPVIEDILCTLKDRFEKCEGRCALHTKCYYCGA